MYLKWRFHRDYWISYFKEEFSWLTCQQLRHYRNLRAMRNGWLLLGHDIFPRLGSLACSWVKRFLPCERTLMVSSTLIITWPLHNVVVASFSDYDKFLELNCNFCMLPSYYVRFTPFLKVSNHFNANHPNNLAKSTEGQMWPITLPGAVVRRKSLHLSCLKLCFPFSVNGTSA